MRLIFAVLLFAFVNSAQPQSFPTQPIRIVVPFAPGGLDLYVRLMAPIMQADLGQPIIVEHRTGAAGFIGAEHVARSRPDGYTLMATAGGSIIGAFLLASNPPFDTLRDFLPITIIYESAQTIVVKAGLPASNLKEFIAYAKSNPGKLSHASTGVGTAQHVDAEAFRLFAGFDSVNVPYAGHGPAIQSLLAGQTDWASLTLFPAKPHIVSGKLKMLATHHGRSSSDLPAVPLLQDIYPGFATTAPFIGLWAPSATPQPVIRRLNAASVKALRDPTVKSKVEEGGAVIGANSPEEFLAVIKASLESTGRNIKVARAAGVKFE